MKSAQVRVNDEAGNAAATLLCIRAREYEAEFGLVRTRDEYLRAVDDPMVAIPYRACANRTRRVAAARGLRQSEEAALLSPQHRMQIPLLLLLGRLKQLGQPGRAKHAIAGSIEAGAMLRHLDRPQRAGDQIDAGAAILRGDVETPETHLAHHCAEAQ